MNLLSEISKKISKLAQNKEEFFFMIDFNCEDAYVYTPTEAAKNGIFFDISGKTNYKSIGIEFKKKSFTFNPIPYEKYLKGFEHVKNAIQRGDTYLLNYTCLTPVLTDYSLQEIFEFSNSPFKLLFKDRFVVFSPERFIKIQDLHIETRPMKGTIDAAIARAEELLLNNEKELFEHNTIVDLLRNDLNIVAKGVRVEEFRYFDRIKTSNRELLQVSSKIVGELPVDYLSSLGELIASLLPAGSVSGAPKQKTIEIIKSAEDYDRGFYTGVFGHSDSKGIDVAVAIRFIEKINGEFYYKSGGGITSLSQPMEEYQEMLDKIYVPFF